MQTPYRFTILSGLPGCYMPDYHGGAYEATTRREFVGIVRSNLEMLDYPANRIHDFGVRAMWRAIQKFKSGCAVNSSCESHNGERLEIVGLTAWDYDAMQTESDNE